MTPIAFARGFITRWEDGNSTDPARTHSKDPVDAGNWTGGKHGLGALVGSNHGVTAAALALHRHVPPATITTAAMHALTLDEAAEIALAHYYRAPGLDGLPWNRVTASIFDFGWGAGPVTAIKRLQDTLLLDRDGCIGPATARAFAAWVGKGEMAAAQAWAAARLDYYERIIAARPANAKYRNGWANRTRFFLSGHVENWWGKW